MPKMTDYAKAQKELVKALRALNAAAEIIEALPDYNNRASIFHAQTVNQYNRIVTAAGIINEAQN